MGKARTPGNPPQPDDARAADILLDWNIHRRSRNPGCAHLNRGHSFRRIRGNPEINLVAVHSAGETDSRQNLRGSPIHRHTNWRIDDGQGTRWERLAGINSATGGSEAGYKE